MPQARSRVRLGLIAAAVLVLHVAAVWLLLTRSLVLHVRRLTENLQLVFLPPAPPPELPPPAPQAVTLPHRVPRARPAPETAPVPPDIPTPLLPIPEENNAITPPVDWDAELTRQAQDSVAAEANQHYREFDFPRPPPGLEKTPEFGWSRTHTHRVESAGGLLVVHLNDHCVLVFLPLPFAFCGVGHIPVNDQLFKHMHDPPPSGGGSAP
jgi:hypothetical protein